MISLRVSLWAFFRCGSCYLEVFGVFCLADFFSSTFFLNCFLIALRNTKWLHAYWAVWNMYCRKLRFLFKSFSMLNFCNETQRFWVLYTQRFTEEVNSAGFSRWWPYPANGLKSSLFFDTWWTDQFPFFLADEKSSSVNESPIFCS